MQSFCGSVRLARRQSLRNSIFAHFKATGAYTVAPDASAANGVSLSNSSLSSVSSSRSCLLGSLGPNFCSQVKPVTSSCYYGGNPGHSCVQWAAAVPPFRSRFMTTDVAQSQDSSASFTDVAPRIKFKRLDKTARNIMQILDKEAVEEVKSQREIPDIKPGYIVQLKVEVPENKRRTSTVKGIVIARRNAGLNTTFRIRRLVAGVGVESLFPLYSPNIKEIKVLDKKRVRRAKLYYLRDKMNALKKH